MAHEPASQGEARPTHEDRLRRLHLGEEMDLAVSAVRSGLALLQMGRPHERQHFLFLLVLSVGIERYLKVVLCIHEYDRTRTFPSPKALRKLSHDLERLTQELLRVGYETRTDLPPALQADRTFLTSDPLLRNVLSVLSDFATRDRYLFMDGMHEPDSTREWMNRRWETEVDNVANTEAERRAFAEEQDVSEMGRKLDALVATSNERVVACLERFCRAVGRTITHTNLGADAKSLGADVFSFVPIRDDELGKRTYNVINSRASEDWR